MSELVIMLNVDKGIYQTKLIQSNLIARQILLKCIVGKQSQNHLKWLSENSRPEVFYKKGFLKNF